MLNLNVIKPSVERIDEKDNLKRIELAGRVCYKSEKKITEDSARAFCENILKRGHTSVMEHSNVIVLVPDHVKSMLKDAIARYEFETSQPALLTVSWHAGNWLFSGNVRAWNDVLAHTSVVCFSGSPILKNAGGLDLTSYLYDDVWLDKSEKRIHSRITLRITCDRGVSHELVRHRVMSFSQESTRYVNYGKNGYTFIEPWWWEHQNGVFKRYMMGVMEYSSIIYGAMIDEGATPQLARAVLPNQIKTEVVVTATPLQWSKFLELRLDKAAHPDMQRIAHLVLDALGDDVSFLVEV